MHNIYNKEKFGIYIHWPFCLSKCPYCDFSSLVNKNLNEQDSLKDRYLNELDSLKTFYQNTPLTSIFFGGGTPSLIKPQILEEIISHIHQNFKIDKDIEISLEANPNTNHKTLFTDLKNAGINRLSLGIQTLLDNDLKVLGRTHNSKQAIDAINQATNIFKNTSIDLIYARPNQTKKDWEKELKKALEFNIKHISLYQLTYEENTPFFKKKNQELDDILQNELYKQTIDIARKYGFEHYEISNFTKDKNYSSHNLLYWQGYDYLGVGPASHGRIKKDGVFYETKNSFHIPNYEQNSLKLSSHDRAIEMIIMGLRLTKGIDLKLFEKLSSMNIEKIIDKNQLNNLIENNYIELKNNHLKITNQARYLTNKIIEQLIKD